MKPTFSSVISLSSVFLLALSAYAADTTLADYRSMFDKKMSDIDAVYRASQRTALDSYGKHLAVAKETLKSKGDLEGITAAIQEIKRFEKEKTVPQEPPEKFPSLLILVQKTYHDEISAAQQAKSKHTANLITQYLPPLEHLKKQLVRQERLDEARSVAEEIDRVEFILGVVQAENHASRTTPVDSTTTPPPLKRGLVLHYGFDKDEQEEVVDKSPQKNHGKAHGAKWTAEGKVGGAYDFDGKDDWIDVGTQKSLDVGKEDFTIALWCKLAGSSEQVIFQRFTGVEITDPRHLGYYELRLSSPRRPNFRLAKRINAGFIHANMDSDLPPSIPMGEWHHVVAVKKASVMIVYADGRKVASMPNKSHPALSNVSTVVGRNNWNSGSNYFHGLIDELMLWNRALSELEIRQLCNAQK